MMPRALYFALILVIAVGFFVGVDGIRRYSYAASVGACRGGKTPKGHGGLKLFKDRNCKSRCDRSPTCTGYVLPAKHGKWCETYTSLGAKGDRRSAFKCYMKRQSARTKHISCYSHRYRYKSCAAGGKVLSVKVSKQFSKASCKKGYSFGWSGSRIWVKRGCRAKFIVRIGVKSASKVNGGWTKWGAYRKCNRSCGWGKKFRYRKCTNPKPRNGGRSCRGRSNQYSSCKLRNCKVNGRWTKWGAYGKCNKSCGRGRKYRYRKCTNPKQRYGGRSCSGRSYQYASCKVRNCPVKKVNGRWTKWGAYGKCNKSCGWGKKYRNRKCTNPKPRYGGRSCSGRSYQYASCKVKNCLAIVKKVNGRWTKWGAYRKCNKSCGWGKKYRYRKCTNPKPRYGGRYCSGRSIQYVSCKVKNCPKKGGWSKWGAYGRCNRSCGLGRKYRYRKCTNPKPRYGGRYCSGRSYQYSPCKVKNCLVNGRWTSWGSYGKCSKPCGAGNKIRYRSCTYPKPQFRGRACSGSPSQSAFCKLKECPVNCKWGKWVTHGKCSKACGSGIQTFSRKKVIIEANGGKCSGKPSKLEKCKVKECSELLGCRTGFIQHKGRCYKVSAEKKNWNDARIACQNLPGNYDLAIIDNIDLFNALKGYTNHWIGLYAPKHKRTFQWINGEKVNFGKTWMKKPWSSNEPNDIGGAEDCVHTTTNGLWNDYSCVAEFQYICGPKLLEWCHFISEVECKDEYAKKNCPDTCRALQKLSTGASQCKTIAQNVFSPSKNKLLKTLPVLPKEFELHLEINVKNFPNHWVSILHLTTRKNCCNYGDRIPALWGNGGRNPYLHVCSAINGNGNTCKNFKISTKKWIKLKVSQRKAGDGSYLFEYAMDNVVAWSIKNTKAKEFKNVKVFGSDPWHATFNGSLRNIQICFK